jgi:superfamily II DNA/RNA helicase
MSVPSTDVAALPENENTEVALELGADADTEATPEAVVTEAVEAEAVQAETEDQPEADAEPDVDAEPEAPAGPNFSDLGLPEGIVRKLAQNGVTAPFPIQAATIPDALAGKDILGRGRTGSGKTLSFGLPLLTSLSGGRTEKKHPRGVILVPTRELAMQVADALQPYGDVLGLKMKVVCGGTSMGNQIYALERGVDILVATPGRLRDIINRGACSLDQIQIAVLDEADQMADLGFMPEVTELLDQIPSGGQRMLFSATLENEIDSLVKRYLKNPVTHEVDAAQGAVTTMTHHVLVVKPKDKAPVTAAIAARKGRTIIFVRTQLGADRVAEQLCEAGVRADALHGGMTQGARTRTLEDFKSGYVNVLVATDVAARGIHVDGIDLVLNVDPAGDHKDYLHRSGRTARAGRSGVVVSLSLPHQRRQIFRLMEDAGVDATRHIVGGTGVFEPEVAEITGARSLTEVQADSAGNAAKQAEREVTDLTKQLERAQRRATELREEADRLIVRSARERGEDPEAAVAAAAEAVLAEAAEAEAQAAAKAATESYDRSERRDDRGNYGRRDDRGDRRDGGDRGGYRRDDRSSGGGFRRDNDRPSSGGFRRDNDRPSGGFRRDDRRDNDRPTGGGFRRDNDRPSSGGFRRDNDRPASGGFRRDNDRRDDRRDNDRPAGGGFRRDDRRDNDRPAGGGFRRDDHGTHRGGGADRPFNRDRRDDRPSGGFRTGTSHDRPVGRRDDHRPSGPGTTGTGTGTGSFGRRDDKPRWKRNG